MWAIEENEIRGAFVEHFKNIFCEDGTRHNGSLHDLDHNLLRNVPKVLPHYASLLDQFPSEDEITSIMFSLNPDRTPGPDGVNVRFIQTNWILLKPLVLQMVNQFFSSGHMPSKLARSNVVLVPKKETPVLVTDYRPISVCNVGYKLISKLLSRRLKPIIPLLVSDTQAAFTLGRQIRDNIIVFREVIHSFSLSSYRKHSFCLKVDLSKAFDRLRWPYILAVMQTYGLPATFTTWVQACVQSASYSILINGSVDGYIQPTNGLRQGCALSPYLFILALDILSRILNAKVQAKHIKGLKIARGGPVLTSLLYADDLLVFGEASTTEMTAIAQVLSVFCDLSGQQIGVEKSRIWFSKNTPMEARQFAMNIFAATLASPSEIYLGSPVAANRQSDFSPLISKIDSKLQTWKSGLLSQAGKLILIKSVVEPIMLYAMQTSAIPITTLKAIQSKIRMFFWGKGTEKRMPLVAWNKITVPKCKGGLGLKDMIKFSQTLHMKSLWAIAKGENSTWVRVLTAKYLHNKDIWTTNRTTRCTHLWRAVLEVRSVMKGNLKWQLGNGTKCKAMGQPWHDMWAQFPPNNAAQRKITVAQLVSTDTGLWHNQKLIVLFGFYGALYLAMTFPNGPPLSQREDRLIFTPSRNGQFSIKAAYNLLLEDTAHINASSINKGTCKTIWHTKQVLPRTRVFLWRAMHEALPVDATLSSRLRRQSQGCSICGADQENATHVLFKCPKAQQVWLLTALALRTDNLPDDVQEVLSFLLNYLDEAQVGNMMATLWQIWKDRCKQVFEGKIIRPQQTIATAQYITFNLKAAAKCFSRISQPTNDQPARTRYTCWTDASWLHPDFQGAGTAFVMFDDEKLAGYWLAPTRADSPFHAELQAFRRAILKLHSMKIEDCTFITDCLLLKLVLCGETNVSEVDWQAYHDAMDTVLIWDSYRRDLNWHCTHMGREHNSLADHFAKHARISDLECEGYTFPAFIPI
ncbi:hypothetical protein LUZ61_003400 [Rhynchospora tenuis]|uniref:Reverse transcriptase domain-containing protein n=1 Tax=Rhynchospora tenuis TaxID=198213 RepID=A0AAD5ZKR2_9POAL|nr:hypothetical protein LUZ61_003400 [Rhynchospora tenuis]